MKKHKKGRTLSRTAQQKKALLRTLTVALVQKGRIETTLAKAKELRPFAERMITRAKNGLSKEKKVAAVRLLKRDLPEKTVFRLFETVELFKDRAGGYTRILKLAPRVSDSAQMAIIELVEKLPEPASEKSSKISKVKDEKTK